ncbi:PhzF family phenazine biosynthesis protein [Actinophytocola gossypii]|uniref:PhzF family phenazine biosynthesis isomerase n=1 Tax=Actinophytocola gossypii TaxID=2812003 RepID=A0ABT2J263_9PSEU|nr:PhzF family phenazine biosynthesis isomerase [Actinophytocola gossypii]MCT2581948.1 PhzF family phenazine biosynthesis isomerase [Actinophytocola gossypii]
MYRYVVADVFTDTALRGNPVAVYLDARGLDKVTMQRIAREMNLSETLFVLPAEADGDVWVRIFTPVNELPFAGHPTLGTAVVLGETHRGDVLRMETAMGTVPFTLSRDGGGRVEMVTMEQPIPEWSPYPEADHLLAALGVEESTLPVEVYRNGPRHVYIGLPTAADLSALRPDQRELAEHLDLAANCFAPWDGRWRTRMFSPAYGVAEDAATGSAAGPLAIHLARHGLAEWDREIVIHQGVEMGRHSVMRARAVRGETGVNRVAVSGSAVVVARGELDLGET